MFKEDETQYCKNCYELQQQLDQLKSENELLKEKASGLACFYETNKEYDKSCIKRAKSDKCIHYGDNICRLDDIRNNPNRDCLRCIKESYLRLYSLNWDNQNRLIKEKEKLDAENQDLYNKNLELQGEMTVIRKTLTEIKEIAEDAKTKVFVDMEDFWEQILQKISEVENV